MAYTHPAYHGGRNHPEQVTDEFLCSRRRHHPPAPNPVPINRLAQVPKEVFIPTQKDRLLRRHNKARGRDDTLYNIQDYGKPCGPGGCCFPNNIQAEGYNGMCSGHHKFPEPANVTTDPCIMVTSTTGSGGACCNSCA